MAETSFCCQPAAIFYQLAVSLQRPSEVERVQFQSPLKMRPPTDIFYRLNPQAFAKPDFVQRNSFQIAAKRSHRRPKSHARAQTEMLRSALTFIESNTIIRSHNEQMIVTTRIWPWRPLRVRRHETQHSAQHRMRRIQIRGRTT
jgi:hypothetical protein